MEKSLGKLSGIIFITIIILLIASLKINAQTVVLKKHHRYRERVLVKKPIYKEIILKKKHYFYKAGVFYVRGPKDYLRVNTPIGARITILPDGYKIVRLRRVKYYVFEGVYYRFRPRLKLYEVVRVPR